MPSQKMYNSKHLQVFSANNEVLTRTAGRPRAFIALVCFPCRIAGHVSYYQHSVMDERVVCLKDIIIPCN